MAIYSFMLKQMTDDQKRQTYGRILEQILLPAVSREVDIVERRHYQTVLLDAVRVLGSTVSLCF